MLECTVVRVQPRAVSVVKCGGVICLYKHLLQIKDLYRNGAYKHNYNIAVGRVYNIEIVYSSENMVFILLAEGWGDLTCHQKYLQTIHQAASHLNMALV